MLGCGPVLDSGPKEVGILTAQAARGVHLGLGREDEEKEEEEEEGIWFWDLGEEEKAEAREGTVILHLCGEFWGAESLSTDQEASGSYRNAPPPPPCHLVCPVLTFLEGQHSGPDDNAEGTQGIWPRPLLSIFIPLQTD